MIFDTDVLIWAERGNTNAMKVIDADPERSMSIQTLLELFQQAENKLQLKHTKKMISTVGFKVIPITEEIGNKALLILETYGLSSGIQASDSLIAATAMQLDMPLVTANAKHFRSVVGLDLRVFKP